eukprot:151938-Prorocentrum_minimum.AAC.2
MNRFSGIKFHTVYLLVVMRLLQKDCPCVRTRVVQTHQTIDANSSSRNPNLETRADTCGVRSSENSRSF